MTDTALKSWLEDFTHVDTGDVKREKFVLYARKGNTGDYTAVGYKQESAAIANNYDTSTMTDILGVKYTDINDKDEQIEMSEYHINSSKSAFLDLGFEYTLAGLENDMNDYELLMVCMWLTDSDDQYLARHVTGVTLQLDNLGGQSFTMADVTWSGISRGEMGTVTFTGNQPTFVAAA